MRTQPHSPVLRPGKIRLYLPEYFEWLAVKNVSSNMAGTIPLLPMVPLAVLSVLGSHKVS